MTPIGTFIPPKATNKEKKLIESKYKIFLESIEIQKRWRKEMKRNLTNVNSQTVDLLKLSEGLINRKTS
jgi:hypothetical protein